tara:strand:+ start:2283 stop:2828 length:546 start_codon:yes stop_codon:yes gene_type:complete
MSIQEGNSANIKWIGVTSVLFGVLLIANHANEILKQAVIVPGSVAESALAPDCRPDELEEENLSLRECHLMVSSVQIILASSTPSFRAASTYLYLLGCVFALFSMVFGMRFVNSPESAQRPLRTSFVLLVVLDLLHFTSVSTTGPLLRSIYLWPNLLWFFIHLALLAAIVSYNPRSKQEAN